MTGTWTSPIARMICACASALAFGCGPPPAPEHAPPALTSERDPPAYTPSPTANAETGGVAALATSGGVEQARTVAMHLLIAIRDGDEPMLLRLLNEQLAHAHPRISEVQSPRAQVIQRLLQDNVRRSLASDTPIESLVDLEHIDLQPLREVYQGGRSIPAGLEPSDVFLTFPLHDAGRVALQPLLGWSQRGAMIIRTGVEPRVMAL